MGCTPSKAVCPSKESRERVADGGKGSQSKSNSGEWTEKSPDKDRKGPNVRVHAEGGTAAPDPDGGSFNVAELGKGGTRARRLSYITPDQQMLQKLREEYEKNYPEGTPESSNHSQSVVLQQQQGKRPSLDIALEVAAMCVTGQESGFKKTCQDANFAYDTFIAEGTGQAIFGAMDGHGPQGHLVAGALKRHLPHILAEHIARGGDLDQAMKTGFLQADRLLASSNVDCQYSGSTCSVAYLEGTHLTVAWVGDSRVVLGKQASNVWTAADLSTDHKPTTNDERNRIWKAGGRIERCLNEDNDPVGPYRVWLKESWVPGLAMSRSLGDQLAHSVGVISEPDVNHFQLNSCDKFIILASDGVWEFMSSQEAVDLVAKCKNVTDASNALCTEAYKRWLTEEEGVVDDITAVVVALQHGNTGNSSSKDNTFMQAGKEDGHQG